MRAEPRSLADDRLDLRNDADCASALATEQPRGSLVIGDRFVPFSSVGAGLKVLM
jgi:hypothetical protein